LEAPAPAAAKADLRHIDTWLFDLDNTLYPPEAGVLELVEEKILAYFVALTGLPADEAWALQRRYLEEHGSATPGLVRHHEVDPHEFLRAAHDVNLDGLRPDPRLRRALLRLPGRRLVFTNGSQRHAERVLERLGLDPRPRPRSRLRRLLRGPVREPASRRRARHDHHPCRRRSRRLDRSLRAL
jgi:putative hydrolase of the HAD superfamily